MTLNNAAPAAGISGPSSATVGKSGKWIFSATDPSAADQAGAFSYAIDWNGDGKIDKTVNAGHSTSVSHTFKSPGSVTVKVTATDRNGGKSARASKAVKVLGGKIKSAKLMLGKKKVTALGLAQAKRVKLTVKFSPKSKLFKWKITLKHGKKWKAVKSATKRGSFAKKTMTVKKLFSGKKMKKGSYKLRLSADRNSKTLKFKIK